MFETQFSVGLKKACLHKEANKTVAIGGSHSCHFSISKIVAILTFQKTLYTIENKNGMF